MHHRVPLLQVALTDTVKVDQEALVLGSRVLNVPRIITPSVEILLALLVLVIVIVIQVVAHAFVIVVMVLLDPGRV